MDYVRQAAFMAKGLTEFTKFGYTSNAKTFSSNDDKSFLAKKTILITGANSGIGFETAKALAAGGATIHMVCRNEQKGKEALLKVIANSHSGVTPKLHIVDLSKPQEIIEFCDKFKRDQFELDILINNAGCMASKRTVSDVGRLETNFCTNTFAPYVLITKLLPMLETSSSPRVITVSSGGMLTEKLKSDDLNSEKCLFDSTKVYAQNKRQQIVMMDFFARLKPAIFFASMHPGWADTPAVRTSMPSFYASLKRVLRTPEQAADTVVWLASCDGIEKRFENGSFFFDRKSVSKHLMVGGTQSTVKEENIFMAELALILNDIEKQI